MNSLERWVLGAVEPTLFFARSPASLVLLHRPLSVVAWEVYLGHLLGPTKTRRQCQQEAWELVLDDASHPLLAVRWNPDEQHLFVTRALWVHGWQPYESSPGVIESRRSAWWEHELVGSIDLADRGPVDDVVAELRCLVRQAVAGTSRLPITSVESPLPAFVEGRLAYLPESTDSAADVLPRAAGTEDAARGLEFALRAAAPDERRPIADWLAANVAPAQGVTWFRDLFNQVSLTPHLGLLDNAIGVLSLVASDDRWGAAAVADIASYMIRHLVRHLTAYDLVTFHSFGANYPDALWIDSLLKLLITLVERSPATFAIGATTSEASSAPVLRRRALRQGWLVRLRYEGLRVPDAPTSQGERERMGEVAEPPGSIEPLTDPAARPRKLFDGDPLERPSAGPLSDTLRRALDELSNERELRELGLATFVDRPFGVFKEPGEVDRTPLLAYEAFSRRRALERLDVARDGGLIDAATHGMLAQRLAELKVPGIPVDRLPGRPRRGVIMLEDAQLASDDFVVTRTTAGSMARFAAMPAGLSDEQRRLIRAWAAAATPRLWIRTSGPGEAARGLPLLTCYDDRLRPIATTIVVPPPETMPVYRERRGVEYLAAGLRFETPSEPCPNTASS